jgi:hypothetical protein
LLYLLIRLVALCFFSLNTIHLAAAVLISLVADFVRARWKIAIGKLITAIAV